MVYHGLEFSARSHDAQYEKYPSNSGRSCLEPPSLPFKAKMQARTLVARPA